MVESRGSGQHRDLLALDEFEHPVDVEYGDRQDRGAADHRGDQSGLVTEHVEERIDDHVAVASAEIGEIAPFRDIH